MDMRPPLEVCEQHGVSQEQFEELATYAPFWAAVAEHCRCLLADGVKFKQMAKMAASDAVAVVHRLMHKADSDATKLASAKLLGEWSEFGVERSVADKFVFIVNMPAHPSVDQGLGRDVTPAVFDRAAAVAFPLVSMPTSKDSVFGG